MKGFVLITQANNQGTYINISHIMKFFRKNANNIAIVTSDSKEIECKTTLDELVKLIDEAS